MDNTGKDAPTGYRPGLLIARQFVDVTSEHLVCSDGEGQEKWRIAWTEISGLAFVEYSARGAQVSRLDIHTRNRAARRSLGCNSLAIDAETDPEYVAFRAIVRAIANRLGDVSPDLPVTIGEYGRTRIWIFIIGALSTLAALALGVAALAGGRGEALIPVSGILLFGLFLVWGNAPWRALPRIPVKLFAQALATMQAAPAGSA